MRRRLAAAIVALLLASAADAAPPRFKLVPIERPADMGEVALWPKNSLPPANLPESWARLIGDFGDHVMDARIVRNVSQPTITPFLPDPAKATGAAVIVAPGGAFLSLSMDSEGYAAARWLAEHGIAAFVLKYRLNETPADKDAFMRFVDERMGSAIRTGGVAEIREPRAAMDALQAMKLVRQDAAKYRIDPARVGIMGFSAGAMTALQSELTGEGTGRPAFIGYVYGPMLPIAVPRDAPPLFAALALDDPLFGRQGFGIIDSWHKAGRPVELHAYQQGDHGFGTGVPGTTTTLVMEEFRLWLESNGLLKPAAGR